MNDSLAITPNLCGAIVTAADAARIAAADLLKVAAGVTTVTDRLDADDATVVLRRLKEYASDIDTQREQAKAPVLAIGRSIDALAKELTGDVKAQVDRIARLVGSFEVEERRKAEEARVKANNEAQRIAREAETAAILARRKAPDAEAEDRASDAIVEAAQSQIVAVKQQVINAAPPKAAGSQLRDTICFEVEDAAKLYADSPALVVLEPNGTAIRAIIRANPNIQIPGLRHWREAKLNVR